jgi:hypothetical protein
MGGSLGKAIGVRRAHPPLNSVKRMNTCSALGMNATIGSSFKCLLIGVKTNCRYAKRIDSTSALVILPNKKERL